MTEPGATLLDSSALIALAVTVHEHHVATEAWLGQRRFASCPITQGALVRIVARLPGGGVKRAVEYLRAVTRSDRHEFWPDDIGYSDVRMAGVIGPRQVTDAYLAELARRRGGRLATLDRALASLHDDVAELVPT